MGRGFLGIMFVFMGVMIVMGGIGFLFAATAGGSGFVRLLPLRAGGTALLLRKALK